MTTSNFKIMVPRDIHKVWETISAVEEYHTWRSDVDRTDVADEKHFTEYSKDGYATAYTVTAAEPCKRWELEPENDNIKGHWTGVFTSKGDETEIDITAGVSAKKLTTRPVGQSVFEQTYLKREQAQFAEDLKKLFG